MDDLTIIKNMTRYMRDQVAAEYDPEFGKIGLPKPPADNKLDTGYVLVKPAVYDMWIPPKNHLEGYGYDMPCILVMSDGGSDRDGEASVRIRIAIGTYDPGLVTREGVVLSTKPNSRGYIDLLNLLTKIRMKLSDRELTAGLFTVENGIEWGIYEEQHYPYWNAWLTCSCPIISMKNLPML